MIDALIVLRRGAIRRAASSLSVSRATSVGLELELVAIGSVTSNERR